MSEKRLKHASHEHIPASNTALPERLRDWPKTLFWALVRPLFPYLRDFLSAVRVFNFEQFLDAAQRQKFILGHVHPEHSLEKVIKHLVKKGYQRNVIAWKDRGEVASLRLLENFHYQYHIRIFDDREVRAHYEVTPEAHPFQHYSEVSLERREEYFLDLFEGMVLPHKELSNS